MHYGHCFFLCKIITIQYVNNNNNINNNDDNNNNKNKNNKNMSYLRFAACSINSWIDLSYTGFALMSGLSFLVLDALKFMIESHFISIQNHWPFHRYIINKFKWVLALWVRLIFHRHNHVVYWTHQLKWRSMKSFLPGVFIHLYLLSLCLLLTAR